MINQRNLSLNEWKQKFLDEGYYEPWAEVKAKNEYESRLIPFILKMPAGGEFPFIKGESLD